MRKIFQKLTLTFFALTTSLTVYSYQSPNDLILNEECQNFLKTIEANYEIRWLQTSETPTSINKISVLYYYKKNSKFNNPVIFFNGGPGFSSHSNVERLEKAQDQFLTPNIDFIYMDQRGTGCSSPYPLGVKTETLEKLKSYGSVGIVRDAEEIRRQLLGERKWKIFGQSYGSFIVHRYLKMFPDSILKVYAHGYPIGATDFDFSYNRIASEYQIIQKYFLQYPIDRLRLTLLNIYLSDSKKCFKNQLGQEYCGYEVLTPLLLQIGFHDTWEVLHSWIVFMVSGHSVDEVAVQNFVNTFAINTEVVHNGSKQNFEDQSIALNFFGVIDRESRPLDSIICRQIYDKMKLQLKISADDIILDQCKAPVQYDYKDPLFTFLKSSLSEPVDYVQILDIKTRLKNFKIPMYLYSGELDCYVPKVLFNEEVKTLGALIKYTNFPKTGHDGYFSEKQVFSDLSK